MAVQFQRRNQGVLAELPDYSQVGQSAYIDYGATPVGQETMAGPLQGEVLPPEGSTDVSRAEQAAAQLIAAAEAQRSRAGQPLNRILSGIGGVIGAPFNFLGAALGGGDMQTVTAPFRPQQTADQRFQQTLLGIQDTMAGIRAESARTQASLASAANSAADTEREARQASGNELAQVAYGLAVYTPEERMALAESAFSPLVRERPELAPILQSAMQNGMSDHYLNLLMSGASDSTLRTDIEDWRRGYRVVTGQDGQQIRIPTRRGVNAGFFDSQSLDPQFRVPFGYQPLAGAPANMQNTPAPPLGPNGVPAVLTQDQYRATVQQMGQEATDAYLQRNGVQVIPDVQNMSDEEIRAAIQSRQGAN